MKKVLLAAGLGLATLLGFFILTAGWLLVDLALRWHPAAGLVAGLLSATLFVLAVLYPMVMLTLARRRSRHPWVAGNRLHKHYLAQLVRLHQDYPTVTLNHLPEDHALFLDELYIRLIKESNQLLEKDATNIFFHTAISQSGRMDILILLRAQVHLVNRLARLYHPQPGLAIYASLYADVLDASLSPSEESDIDYGSQIGPAIVGASVVGAIPGANLVSMIIADAVVQGSANALSILRTGLLTRRFFHRRLEGGPFDLNTERRAVNEEALDILAGLVTESSATLSRTIWEAAREHLLRIPGATLAGLKTAVTKSVRGLTRKGRAKIAQSTEDEG